MHLLWECSALSEHRDEFEPGFGSMGKRSKLFYTLNRGLLEPVSFGHSDNFLDG